MITMKETMEALEVLYRELGEGDSKSGHRDSDLPRAYCGG